ncbi:hypothetical protein PT110_09520, partial [Erysipelothrix rhusiopathiae]|nr:hypothetical protein [Erysipelothrix rhusiopathiae]
VAGPAVFDNGDDAKAAAAQKFADFMINDEVWGKRTLLATGNFTAPTVTPCVKKLWKQRNTTIIGKDASNAPAIRSP